MYHKCSNTPLSFSWSSRLLRELLKERSVTHIQLSRRSLFLYFTLFYLVSFFFFKDVSAGCGLFFSQKFILLHFQSYFAGYVLFCAFFQNFKDVISEHTLCKVIAVLLTISPVLCIISVTWNVAMITVQCPCY